MKQADDGTVRALLINSGGGEVGIGMDFGQWVHEREFDVVVATLCVSPCANYVFPAGKRKWILPRATVAWHGRADMPEAATWLDHVHADEGARLRDHLVAIRAKQRAFYATIGVNECITRVGFELGARGFFTMPPEDM